ncbi:MAG: hypothetical protein K8I27_16370 [Planctomycetes bacterium]|nr:hypothetical protein [Planctomycetota bacterium]
MMRSATFLILLTLATPLMAQIPPGTQLPEPSAAKESFVMQPAEVDKGARDFSIRMVSNEPAGFSNSSSKPPNVTFSAGVTLKPGSFQILNQNEAECRVDVDNDAVGTCEVRIELFSVNGSTVLSTLRGTLGIKGTSAVTGSQAQVGAESVRLVQVNVSTPQSAGVIVIKGGIAGTVTVNAPTGTNFAVAPVAVINSGDINSPALSQANTVFTFSIGNPGLNDITARVTDIQYNTQLFGVTGGTPGDLACEVSGAALSNQSALVINAFTAKTEIAGSNDNTEPAISNPSGNNSTDSETSNSSSAPAASSINSAGRRELDSNDNNRTNREDRNNNARRSGAASRALAPSGGSGAPTARMQPPPPGGNAPPAPAPAPPPAGGGGVVGAGGAGGAHMGGTGSMKEERGRIEDAVVQVKEAPPRKLQVSPGLYFCDSDFAPVSALVLNKSIQEEAGGRVWIVLKVKQDKHADKIETATVKFTLGGTTRELTLTETGKNTGEFRCGKEGILVVANENPNSNEVEKEPEPPKARFPK